MIVVACGICSSEDLRHGQYRAEFYCPTCDKTRQLYEVRFIERTRPIIETVNPKTIRSESISTGG